jgi:hypothetical protein
MKCLTLNECSYDSFASVLPLSLAVAAVALLLIPHEAFAAWKTDTGSDWKSTSSYELDPSGWADTIATLPGFLYASQLAVIGNYVYLFGGADGSFNNTNVIYRARVSDPKSWADIGFTIPGRHRLHDADR